MAKNKIAVVELDLDAEAKFLNENQVILESEIRLSLNRVLVMGEHLVKLKDYIPYGGWETWVDNNLEFSARQARTYMLCWNEQGAIDVPQSGDRLATLLTRINQARTIESTEAEVDEKVETDTIKHITAQLEEWKETSDEWEEKAEELTKELNELKKTESSSDVDADIKKLQAKRKVIMDDINGAEEAKKAIKITREMLTEQLSVIPALQISKRVAKATKPDVDALVDLLENLAVALKEKFNV